MRWTPRTALALALFVGLMARLWGALDDGIYWPDEIYQSLEVAHAQVYGYGLIPWEFVDGARNWSLPAVATVLLRLGALFGLDAPPGYIRLVKVVFALLGVAAALGVFRLARAFAAPRWAAVASAAAYSLAAPVIYFSPRAMAENAAAAPVVWGLALLLEEERPAFRRILLGGSLLGLAVLFRLQVAAVALGLILFLVLNRRWTILGPLLATLAVWALVYGGLDAFSWHRLPTARFGGWFHSVFVYVQFNIVEGRGAHWGTSAWTYYFRVLFTSMAPLAVTLGLGLFACLWRRSWSLPLLVGFFLAIHLATPHKEYRFLVPALPLAFAAIGAAMADFSDGMVARLSAVVAVLGLWSLVQLPSLTMGELGAYPERPQSAAWGDFANVNRLLMAAGRKEDLCGIRIDVADLAWTGGSTYLHRRAPLYRRNVPAQLGYFNYLIAQRGVPGLEAVAEDEGVALYRLPIQQCAVDPNFPWKLF
jgi:GPI mannosyltransferase 3